VRVYTLFSFPFLLPFLFFLGVLIITIADYISVGEALKLVSPFKGEEKEVLAFISNIDTAFEVINPDNSDVLYTFVLTRISGEPRVAINHRNMENWNRLRRG
jgi:hypothetical protein